MMTVKMCQNCGKESNNLVGQLVKQPRLSGVIKIVCPKCKAKLSKKKG